VQFGSKLGSKAWFRSTAPLKDQRVRPWSTAVYSFGECSVAVSRRNAALSSCSAVPTCPVKRPGWGAGWEGKRAVPRESMCLFFFAAVRKIRGLSFPSVRLFQIRLRRLSASHGLRFPCLHPPKTATRPNLACPAFPEARAEGRATKEIDRWPTPRRCRRSR